MTEEGKTMAPIGGVGGGVEVDEAEVVVGVVAEEGKVVAEGVKL